MGEDQMAFNQVREPSGRAPLSFYFPARDQPTCWDPPRGRSSPSRKRSTATGREGVIQPQLLQLAVGAQQRFAVPETDVWPGCPVPPLMSAGSRKLGGSRTRSWTLSKARPIAGGADMLRSR